MVNWKWIFVLAFLPGCNSPAGSDADTGIDAGRGDTDVLAELERCTDAIDEQQASLADHRACEAADDCVVISHPACDRGGELAVSAGVTPDDLADEASALVDACSGGSAMFVDRRYCTSFGSRELATACVDNLCQIQTEVTVRGTITFEFDEDPTGSFTYDLFLYKDDPTMVGDEMIFTEERSATDTEVEFEFTATVGEGPHVVGAKVGGGDWGQPQGEVRITDWTEPVDIQATVIAP